LAPRNAGDSASNVAVRRALVTGASSGIGAAFAERLVRDGYEVVLVARGADRLEAVARNLRATYATTVEILVADLSQPAQLLALEEKVAGDTALELLVNNAGFTSITPFDHLDPDAIESMIHVHVLALTRLTRAALPGMKARNRGAIINVSSTGAFLNTPPSEWITYCATKAFVNTFTLGVHQAVRDTGVRVQALCPGWTRTSILEHAGRPWDIPDAATMMPDVLVDASLAGLRLGEVVCAPSLNDSDLLKQLYDLKNAVCARALSSGAPRPLGAANDPRPSS